MKYLQNLAQEKSRVLLLVYLCIAACQVGHIFAEVDTPTSSPISIDLFLSNEHDAPLLANINPRPPVKKVLANANALDCHFGMIVSYKKANGEVYSQIAPISGSIQSSFSENDANKFVDVSAKPIDLREAFEQYLYKNKSLFESSDSISKIRLQIKIRGLLFEKQNLSFNFTREQIFSALFFSDWISIQPEYVQRILSKISTAYQMPTP